MGSIPKLQVDGLTGVSETLLIPLHYRVQESRTGSPEFKDEMAERFHQTIDYDWEKFQGQFLQRVGIVSRTRIFDEQVKAFIANHPDGLIVNLGAGLDTRFYRLDNGRIRWIELDLPDVISFRRRLQEPVNERHTLLSASILQSDWPKETKGSEVLLLAEGLFPYFTEEQHKLIFGYLVQHFPGQEMLFHTSAPSVIRGFVQYSDLSKLRTNAEVQWGLEEGEEVSSLNPRVRFIREFSLLEGFGKLLPAEVLEKLPPEKIKKAAKIVQVRFDQD
jgi:O-methyltransferase involved in polyketide biosynthesis